MYRRGLQVKNDTESYKNSNWYAGCLQQMTILLL